MEARVPATIRSRRQQSRRSGHVRPRHGFTLVELLITLAIIGITAAVVLPQMGLFTQSNRMSDQINQLIRDLNYTRSEAISRGVPVRIQSNNAGTNAGNWADGWIVTELTNNTQLRTTGSAAQPIAQGTTTLTETTTGGGATGTIIFRPNGGVDNAATFQLCTAGVTNYGKQIVISPVGRIISNSNTDRAGATFC